MTHGYRNKFGEERFTTDTLYETGSSVFNAVVKDWFFGTFPVGAIVGTADNTQADNTILAAAAGVVSASGILNISQADNTVLATGELDIKAVVSISQAANTILATGEITTVPIIGLLDITQGDNTISTAAILKLFGAVAVSQDDNVLSATNEISVVSYSEVYKISPDLFYRRVKSSQRVDFDIKFGGR